MREAEGELTVEGLSEQWNFSGFENGARGSRTKKVGSLWKVEKARKIDCSPEPPEGNTRSKWAKLRQRQIQRWL